MLKCYIIVVEKIFSIKYNYILYYMVVAFTTVQKMSSLHSSPVSWYTRIPLRCTQSRKAAPRQRGCEAGKRGWGREKKRFINYRQTSGLLSLLHAAVATAGPTLRHCERSTLVGFIKFPKIKISTPHRAKWPPLDVQIWIMICTHGAHTHHTYLYIVCIIYMIHIYTYIHTHAHIDEYSERIGLTVAALTEYDIRRLSWIPLIHQKAVPHIYTHPQNCKVSLFISFPPSLALSLLLSISLLYSLFV